MHICFIIGAMNYSGAEKVLSIISNGLYELGNQISVILLEQEIGVSTKENGIVTYGAKSTGNKINRIFNRWSNIRKIVKDIKPDVVVSFGSVCNVNSIPSLLGLKFPLIVCERNDPIFDPRKRVEKFIRWFFYRFASGYVFQTEQIKNYFSDSIRKKSAVIANPIVDSGLRWTINKADKRIATVARLDDFQKDHIVMFKAFSKFSEKHPEYVLDVYGDGPDKNLYHSIISDMKMENKIILHGKSQSPLLEILNAEIFLLTSRYEGMPNALMEAMSIGMPCISTDCGGGGAAELTSLTDSGILVPVGDVSAIAAALDKLSGNDMLKNEFSKKALSINDSLSTEKICSQWNEFLLKFIH